ncbi:hypothetical protein [uncultured Dysgonomonas sp.]|mgnify:CR=1 FL=1|uniref:DUF4848 domain-containing protein n=1 Tax=uncultured Dysgonomonas sp. TaxID=206096 RepID=A0A212JG61_9BACT|nr:hypothetical protein [uncultured Dysgonomonas sp.]SBV98429.1 exported hypothetical protein [uncultured Dysgonomonas sp.]
MRKIKVFFTLLLVVIGLPFLATCQGTIEDEPDNMTKTSLSEDELMSIYKDYVYFDTDIFVLKLSKTDALKKGVSPDQYNSIIINLEEMNSFLKGHLEGLKEGKIEILTFPEERVLNKSKIDSRIVLDKNSEFILDRTTKSTYEVQAPNGQISYGFAQMPGGAYACKLGGYTKCMGGIYKVGFTSTYATVETGVRVGFWPANPKEFNIHAQYGFAGKVTVSGTCDCWGWVSW